MQRELLRYVLWSSEQRQKLEQSSERPRLRSERNGGLADVEAEQAGVKRRREQREYDE